MAPNDLKWAKNDLLAKDSEFLPNSAIETQKTQKLGVFAEILPPLEALITTGFDLVQKSRYLGNYINVTLHAWTITVTLGHNHSPNNL